MTKINLLPWREEQREQRNKQFYVGLGFSAVLACIAVYMVSQFFDASLNNQNARNNYLQREIKVLDTQIAEISKLKKTRSDLIERMRLIQDLQGNRPVIVRIFDELARSVPDDLYFTSVKVKGNDVQLKGVARSNNRVSALMRNFDESEWFSNPSLLKVVSTKEGVNEFEIAMTRITPSNEEEKH